MRPPAAPPPLLAALLGVLALAPAGARAAEGVRLGVGAGVVVAPTFLSRNPVFVGGLAALEVDVPLGGRLGLRVSPLLGGGSAAGASDGRLGSVGLPSAAITLGAVLADVQLRLAWTPTLSSGVGALLGVAFGEVAQGTSAAAWFGPSLTPLALRLGGRHELAVWLGLGLAAGSGGVGVAGLLPSIRYAFFF